MLDHLGTDNRVMTDRDNRILTKTYGLQHPMSAVGDQIDVKAAYFATDINPEVIALLQSGHVRYVLSDDRLPTSLPYTGVYVERGEILHRRVDGTDAGSRPGQVEQRSRGRPRLRRRSAQLYDSRGSRMPRTERERIAAVAAVAASRRRAGRARACPTLLTVPATILLLLVLPVTR